MLPKQVTDLTDRFVRVFDSERPAAVEFRRAQDQVAATDSKEGAASDANAIIALGKNITAFVDDRSRFVWRKLQEAVALTEIKAYNELRSDLKMHVAAYCDPVRHAAERYMEDLRKSAEAPASCTVEAKRALAKILANINAEVDLFCAKYAAKRNSQTQSAAAQALNIGNTHEAAGHGARSRATLSRCSARQLLIGHSLPKQDKRKRPLIAVFSFLMVGIGVYVAYKLRKHS